MKERQAKTVNIDDFEQMVIDELHRRFCSHIGLKEIKKIPNEENSPIRKANFEINSSKSHSKKTLQGPVKLNKTASKDSKSMAIEKSSSKSILTIKHPLFESTEYCSFKNLEKEAKKVNLDLLGLL